jgi:hypothetical protein
MELKKGDRVVAVSMGYTLREYEVLETFNGKAAYKTVVDNAQCTLVTMTTISPSGLLTVVHPDEKIDYINCVENFYVSPKIKCIADNKRELEVMEQRFLRAANIVRDIAQFRAKLADTKKLTKYNESLQEIINDLASI